MTTISIEPAEFPWYDHHGYTFSLGLELDGHAMNSGHSGSAWDPVKGKPDVAGGMAEQTQVAYDKQQTVLAAAGLSMSDVTRVVENVTVDGLSHYAEIEQVRRSVFGQHEPVVVTVVVDRLVRRKALVEIEVHASPGGGIVLVSDGNGRWRRDTVREGHAGAIYLPTLLPIDKDGNVVAEGDLVGQYEYCLELAGDLLERAGLSLAQLVSTVDFSLTHTRRERAGIAQVRSALLGPVFPAVAQVCMSGLHRPGVLVALEGIASRHPLRAVNPGLSRDDASTCNPAVQAGNTLYLGGFTAPDMANEDEPDSRDLRSQAQAVYALIFTTMAAAGCRPADLLSTVEFVTPAALAAYRNVGEVRREMLREPYPVSTGVVCKGLRRPELLIEVVATALVPAAV